MKLIRKIVFWCHLTAGVSAGIVIFVMCATGVLLTFEKQITAWADTRDYHVSRPPQSSERLSLSAVLAKVHETQPSSPSSVTIRSDAGAPVQMDFGRERRLFVNPYTGEVLGQGAPRVRAFFQSVTDWHRWLGAQGDNRTVARAVTGACNLVFLFIVASGIYLWWPRSWSLATVRSVTLFRRGLRGRTRDFNWHNTFGFWSALPLLVVVFSAVVISYTWASNLVYRVVGEEPPPRSSASPSPPASNSSAQSRGAGATQSAAVGRHDLSFADGAQSELLNTTWKRAEQQVPDWRSITLRLPTAADGPLSFTIDQGTGGQPQERGQLTLDGKTGQVVKWEPFASYSTGRRLRSYLRFAHTGEVAGVIGQTVAGLASAGGSFLVWTGLSLAFRRFRAWIVKRIADARNVGRRGMVLGVLSGLFVRNSSEQP